jgi:hypothetical protein
MSYNFRQFFDFMHTNFKPVGTKATFRFNEAVFAKAVERANMVH